MTGLLAVLYGAIVYVGFLATFIYAIGFVGDMGVPRSIDHGGGAAAPFAESAAIDLALLGLFALQHSVMARPAFKRGWTRFVPQPIERSTYVLLASLALALLMWQWRPIPGPVWSVRDPVGAHAIAALFWLGWAVLLISTFLISHFELFGLRQVLARLRGGAMPAPEFRTPFFYRRVRHPLYLGFIIAFWAAPTMTQGHFLFAAATTLYILIAIQLEERDLIALFGERYRRYRREVAMLVPLPARRERPSAEPRNPRLHPGP
jgi:protein-S-isoprenylcysteine O-methyltransferase Ste14